MTVRDYYYKHFYELSPKKQFHFATRMKNYFKTHYFDDYLKQNVPSTELRPILMNNDFSKVVKFNLRKPLFEKYPELYGVEATLFRIHHLLVEYNIDTRDEFKEIYPIEKLYQLSDGLLDDEDALKILSSWAINTICLTEELFPRGENATGCLAEFADNLNPETTDATLFVYLCTHIIICESNFYIKKLNNSINLKLLKNLLKKCSEVIDKNIDTISLDAGVEFLVCCNLVGVEYDKQKYMVKEICDDFKQDSPYLINYRRDKTPGSYYHTLDGAEHINALYIMSGLDSE